MTQQLTRECTQEHCRAEVLPLLYEISQAVTNYRDMDRIISCAYDVMHGNLGIIRAMFTLFNRRSGKIFIKKSFGLSAEEEARGIYKIGEGITGQVVATGKSIVIPNVSVEPAFLNRTQSRKSDEALSFICVPLNFRQEVLGTISAYRIVDNENRLKHDLEILSIMAAMIAQAMELYRMEHEEKHALEEENLRLRGELQERFRPQNMLGNSKPMQYVYDLISKISPARTTVLILGESGVGKELVANAIHYGSSVASGPFIKFNCAALPESIIESELFGHEKGAFTGAHAVRKGRFEAAHGGTIFLDEIGELSLPMQTKLLRVLQEKTFERIGGNTSIQVDIRVIAATNRDLGALIKEGRFREDLYYRLNVFPITIPPLRERSSDITLLADVFTQKYSQQNGKRIKRISTPALDMLMSYHWPGNVRELENIIERAVILSDDEVLHGYHLPPSLQTAEHSGTRQAGSLSSRLDSVEYELLVEALKTTHGNITLAAAELGLTKRIMGLRLEKYGIDYRTFRHR